MSCDKFLIMELYERIAEALASAKKKGITVSHVASACGITRQAVYQWAKIGANSIDGANLVELAELSGYNARWIANGKGPKTKSISGDEQLIISALPIISPDLRDSWIDAAKRAIAKANTTKDKAA